MDKSFGVRLREVRLRAGHSQGTLAKKLDCPKESLSRYETGHVTPGWVMLCRLADALGVSLDEFRTPPAAEQHT